MTGAALPKAWLANPLSSRTGQIIVSTFARGLALQAADVTFDSVTPTFTAVDDGRGRRLKQQNDRNLALINALSKVDYRMSIAARSLARTPNFLSVNYSIVSPDNMQQMLELSIKYVDAAAATAATNIQNDFESRFELGVVATSGAVRALVSAYAYQIEGALYYPPTSVSAGLPAYTIPVAVVLSVLGCFGVLAGYCYCRLGPWRNRALVEKANAEELQLRLDSSVLRMSKITTAATPASGTKIDDPEYMDKMYRGKFANDEYSDQFAQVGVVDLAVGSSTTPKSLSKFRRESANVLGAARASSPPKN